MQVISHIERLGQHIIVLHQENVIYYGTLQTTTEHYVVLCSKIQPTDVNSIKATMDMLDKKSSPYSDRPFFYGWRTYWREGPLPLLPYGDRFRWHRKFTASLAVAPL
jgi:hypothetical protein